MAPRSRSQAPDARAPKACSQPSSSRSQLGLTRARAKKRLGQHFLHDPAVIRRLVDAIRPRPGDTHRRDRRRARRVDDPAQRQARAPARGRSRPRARGRLADAAWHTPSGSSCTRRDALEFDFGALAAGPRSLRVVGNLPYNISTPLLFHLATFAPLIKDLHVMLQREVVDRMTAAPGGKDYGRLTVMLNLWARAETCFDIGPGAFTPPPKVWSTVVRLVPHARRRSQWPIEKNSHSSSHACSPCGARLSGATLKGR